MIELFNLHENIYKIGLPIIILNGGIFKEDENSPAYIKIVMQNITDKPIKSVTMDMHVFDKANNVVELIRDYVYYADNVERNGLIGVGTYNYLSHENPSSMSIAVKSVAFAGEENDVWQGSSSLLFEAMSSKTPLEKYFEEYELSEQYQRDFAEKLAKDKEVLATVQPFIYKDLWCCSCGSFNHNYEEDCLACGANFKDQVEYLQDYLVISENLRLYKEKEQEEKDFSKEDLSEDNSSKNTISADDFYDKYESTLPEDDFSEEDKSNNENIEDQEIIEETKLDILDFGNEAEYVPEEKEKKIVMTDKIKKTVFISAIVLIVAVVVYLAILIFYIIPNQELIDKSTPANLLSFVDNFCFLIHKNY